MIRRGTILFSPILVFSITWIITLSLYLLNPFQLETIRPFTWFVIVSGLSMVYLGYYSAKMISEGFILKEYIDDKRELPFSFKNMYLAIIILATISLIGRLGTSYLVFTELGGIDKYLLQANEVRKFLIEVSKGNTGVNVLYFKIFSYMGSFTTIAVVLAASVANAKKSKLISLYPLLVAAFHSVSTLQRVYFVKHYVIWLAASFIVIYYYPLALQKDAIRRFVRNVIYFVLITFIFVTLVVLLRHFLVPGSQLQKVINSFYFYIAGNIFWLDKYLITDPEPLYGISILRSILSWFYRFGLVHPSALIVPHYEFYRIYDTLGNTFTYLRIPFEDFNIIGVILFSYIWGWVTFLVLKKYLTKFSFVRLYLATLFIYSFFWSFFGFALTKFTTILWKVFLFLIIDKFFFRSQFRVIQEK